MRQLVPSILVACVLCAGCERTNPGDVRVQGHRVPQGTAVQFTEEVTTEEDLGATESSQRGNSNGAGLATSAAEQVGSFNPEAPSLTFSNNGDGTSSGGGAAFEFDLQGWKLNELAIVGAILLLAALIAGYLRRIPLAVALAAGAALCFFGSALPLWVIGACIIGAAVVYWKTQGSHEALRGIVEGIEDLPDSLRQAAKSAISKRTDALDKSVIRAVKKADDLPSER